MESRNIIDDLKKVWVALPRAAPAGLNPALIMMTGLPGTGKSYLARQIAVRLPAVVVESDHIRQILFSPPSYTGSESAWVHRCAHVVMKRLLRSGRSVIYDATNLSERHRERIYHLASRTSAELFIVRTVAPESVIRERLISRFKRRRPLDISDADWRVYEHLKQRSDPIRRRHLVVDTSRDIHPAINRILRAAQKT